MNTEKHKQQCAVRQMLKYRHEWGLEKFRAYINDPKTQKLWSTLRDDFIIQWRLGNRGDFDHWVK